MDSSSNLLVLISVVLAGAAHIRIGNLRERVDLLDPKKALPLPQENTVELPPEPKPAVVSVPTGPNPLWKWLSTDWPMKLGAFLILLAFGWLTTYAFINNWIGPVGRIALGVGSGILIMGLGEWRIRKYAGQGAVFTALGAATVLVSLFAARNVYDFFTPLTALLGMLAVTVTMGISSLRHKNNALAIVGLLMGGLAPLLVNSPDPNYIGLFYYLLALTVAALSVFFKTGWKVLTFLSFLIIFFYSGETPLMEADKLGAMIFAFLFTGLFYLSNLAIVWENKKSTKLDVAFSIGNSILLLRWTSEAVPETWLGATMALLAVALLGITYGLYRRINQEKILLPYLFTGAICLGIATAEGFENAALTLAYAWEAAALIALGTVLTKDSKVALKLSPLLFPAVLLGMVSMDNALWENGLYNLHFAALLSLTVLIWTLAFYIHRTKELGLPTFLVLASVEVMILVYLCTELLLEGSATNLAYTAVLTAFLVLVTLLFNDPKVSRFFPLLLLPSLLLSRESVTSSTWENGIWHLDFALLLSLILILLGLGFYFKYHKEKFALGFFVLSGLYAMGLTWLSSDALIQNPNLHVTVSLGIYTLVGLFFNLRGAFKDEKVSRITGGVLIGFVVARLLLVDVWEMSIGAKVVTFFIVGALLISTAFFNKKLSKN